MSVVTSNLYHFATVEDVQKLHQEIKETCQKLALKGLMLVAPEGINGTLSGTKEGIDGFIAFIKSYDIFKDIEHKESFTDDCPFHRLSIKVKKKLITINYPDANPNVMKGEYCNSEEWNSVLSDPNVILIDTRNDYEVKLGKFKNAIDPDIKSFTEFTEYIEQNLADKKDRPIAMYCTGGIRCEKASSYMLNEGFKTVYHLKGGILKYLEEMPSENSMWEGNCYVFDRRVSVGHGLVPSNDKLCFVCRAPLTEVERKSDKFVEGEQCPYCCESIDAKKRNAKRERQLQIELAKSKNEVHVGMSGDSVKAKRQQRYLQIHAKDHKNKNAEAVTA